MENIAIKAQKHRKKVFTFCKKVTTYCTAIYTVWHSTAHQQILRQYNSADKWILHTATSKALMNKPIEQRPTMVTERWTTVTVHFKLVLIGCLHKIKHKDKILVHWTRLTRVRDKKHQPLKYPNFLNRKPSLQNQYLLTISHSWTWNTPITTLNHNNQKQIDSQNNSN